MINFTLAKNADTLTESAAFLLQKYAKKDASAPTVSVHLVRDRECLGDDYRIFVDADTVTIHGNSVVSFNAAVGYLLRNQFAEPLETTVHFQSEFRAVYFANHFFNYYHAAPIEEVCEYLESLALWGQNALVLWFDMHHFPSLSAPDAQSMLRRMKAFFQKARTLGMKTCLTRLTNEYYTGAPAALLAENSTESGRYHKKLSGYYYTELCPSKKEGEALLLQSCDEFLQAFSEIEPDYLILWPYDQGGCTCTDCYPWGSHGFFDLASKQAALAKKRFPKLRIILSCWRFDFFTDGEWEGLLARIRQEGDWIDYLMVDINAPLPAALSDLRQPILSFPEISMALTPWGGFGVCPIPRQIRENMQKTKELCSGGALYSEGIFEDIDKAVSLELMRDPDIAPRDTILSYCRYHFGSKYAEALTELILQAEDSAPRHTRLANGEINDYPDRKPEKPHTYVLEKPELVKALAERLQEIHTQLPETVRANWRYRQIYCRIRGDACLVKNNGIPCDETDQIYEELVTLYHAKQASYWVSPITRESILANRGGSID